MDQGERPVLNRDLPREVAIAARDGDIDAVRDWLAAGGGPPAIRPNGKEKNLSYACMSSRPSCAYLLSRGASIDETHTGHTALLVACYCGGGTVTEMVELLLSAGANPNFRNQSGESGRTPISAHARFCRTPSVECVTALLRAGASLDRVYKEQPFETQAGYNEMPAAIRALAAGVRRHGSLKSYLREPHREVLALRGLAMRGHLVPRRRTRGAAEWKAAVAFLARHGDNGVVWNVLSFWRATK